MVHLNNDDIEALNGDMMKEPKVFAREIYPQCGGDG